MEENNNQNNKEQDYQRSQLHKIVAKLKPIIASKPEILFAYLFGSAATGKINKLSDIDLAIFIDPSYRHQSAGYGYQSEMIIELSAILSAQVDLVILNHASSFLRYQVLKKGILLFSRSNEMRRSFHEKTMRNYLDLKPLFKVQRDYMHKRLAAGKFGGSKNG